jgi:hypothetical protein
MDKFSIPLPNTDGRKASFRLSEVDKKKFMAARVSLVYYLFSLFCAYHMHYRKKWLHWKESGSDSNLFKWYFTGGGSLSTWWRGQWGQCQPGHGHFHGSQVWDRSRTLQWEPGMSRVMDTSMGARYEQGHGHFHGSQVWARSRTLSCEIGMSQVTDTFMGAMYELGYGQFMEASYEPGHGHFHRSQVWARSRTLPWKPGKSQVWVRSQTLPW